MVPFFRVAFPDGENPNFSGHVFSVRCASVVPVSSAERLES